MSFNLYASPIARPDLWDVVYVGGIASPGIAHVTTPGIDYKWDKKKGPGIQKRTMTFRGQDGSDVKIKFELWTEEHFKLWETYQGFFELDPTKSTVKAISVIHPKLVFLKIFNLVTERIGPIEEHGRGLYSVTVELSEYAPPPKKNVTKTPTSVRQGTTTVEHVTPETAAERRLRLLREKAAQP